MIEQPWKKIEWGNQLHLVIHCIYAIWHLLCKTNFPVPVVIRCCDKAASASECLMRPRQQLSAHWLCSHGQWKHQRHLWFALKLVPALALSLLSCSQLCYLHKLQGNLNTLLSPTILSRKEDLGRWLQCTVYHKSHVREGGVSMTWDSVLDFYCLELWESYLNSQSWGKIIFVSSYFVLFFSWDKLRPFILSNTLRMISQILVLHRVLFFNEQVRSSL